MWLELDRRLGAVRQEGLERRRARSGADLYVSPGAPPLGGVADLSRAEYCQAIEIDLAGRRASFGRDYLGHHPLAYATAGDRLFLTDSVPAAVDWLRREGERPTLSEEAVALYLAMGYVPQGMTLYREVVTCRNASVYRWDGAAVTHDSTFAPIAADERFPLAELRRRIEAGVRDAAPPAAALDVWCSGGLDSSIVALCARRTREARLLTLGYGEARDTQASELRFAAELAAHLGTAMREVPLTRERWLAAFDACARTHVGPTVDYVVPLKYALAEATREAGLTGEGGDPLFAGAKNDFIAYVKSRRPELPLGHVYARSHNRLYELMPALLRRGAELQRFVDSYLQRMLDRYPGGLLRKLFYVNTFEKQGGMIFPKNYGAGRSHGVRVRHPLASLEVCRAAFALPDERKYAYPRGKLALVELYRDELPASILERRKSGTRLPLDRYLGYLAGEGYGVEAIRQTGFFREEALERFATGAPRQRRELVLRYGLLSLDAWLQWSPPGSRSAAEDGTSAGPAGGAGGWSPARRRSSSRRLST